MNARRHPNQQYFPYFETCLRQKGNGEQKLIINEVTEINVVAMDEVEKMFSLKRNRKENTKVSGISRIYLSLI